MVLFAFDTFRLVQGVDIVRCIFFGRFGIAIKFVLGFRSVMFMFMFVSLVFMTFVRVVFAN